MIYQKDADQLLSNVKGLENYSETEIKKIIISRLKKVKLKDVIIDESDGETVHVTIKANVESPIDYVNIKLRFD